MRPFVAETFRVELGSGGGCLPERRSEASPRPCAYPSRMCSTSIAWRSFPAYNAAFRNTPKLFLKSGHTSAGHRLYKATTRNSPPTDQSVDYSSCRLCKIDFGTPRPIRGSNFQKGVAFSAFVYLGSTALPRASPHLSHIQRTCPVAVQYLVLFNRSPQFPQNRCPGAEELV